MPPRRPRLMEHPAHGVVILKISAKSIGEQSIAKSPNTKGDFKVNIGVKTKPILPVISRLISPPAYFMAPVLASWLSVLCLHLSASQVAVIWLMAD